MILAVAPLTSRPSAAKRQLSVRELGRNPDRFEGGEVEVFEPQSQFQAFGEEDRVAKLVVSTPWDQFDFIVQPLKIGTVLISRRLVEAGFLDQYGSVLEDKYLPRRCIQLEKDPE